MSERLKDEIPDHFRSELESSGKIVIAKFINGRSGEVIAEAFGSSEDVFSESLYRIGQVFQYYPEWGDVSYELITVSKRWFGRRTFKREDLGTDSTGGFEKALEALG